MKGEFIVLDLGANTKLSARYLIDNAILGSSLATVLLKIEKPSIYLLMLEKKIQKEMMK